MAYYKKSILAVLFCGLIFSFAPAEVGKSEELVLNPDLSSVRQGGMPDNWTAWNPVFKKSAFVIRPTPNGLMFEAPGRPYAVGGVFQHIKNIKGGQPYLIKATCRLQNIPDPYRSVYIRVNWTKAGKRMHPAGMLVRGPVLDGQIADFEDVLIAPEEADGAKITMDIRWPHGGTVLLKRVRMHPTTAPKPRKVKIGTVYLRPSRSTTENNLNLFCKQIDDAGKLGLDIVCLGEAITSVGTKTKATDCAELIPGPTSKKLGNAARKNRIWVVAGIYERDGDHIYNTAILLDRNGKVAGKYRKIHLPRGEWKDGVTPGDSYPVFQTDFGTIAIQICYDWFFPESTAIFALQGAEIVFAPTWGNTLPDKDGQVNGESTFRVRARDNGVYMVPSVYSGNSLIIDPMGKILTSSKGKKGIFWAEVDLNARERLLWVGYWRSIGPRHRMAGTYAPLLKYPDKPTY